MKDHFDIPIVAALAQSQLSHPIQPWPALALPVQNCQICLHFWVFEVFHPDLRILYPRSFRLHHPFPVQNGGCSQPSSASEVEKPVQIQIPPEFSEIHSIVTILPNKLRQAQKFQFIKSGSKSVLVKFPAAARVNPATFRHKSPDLFLRHRERPA